MAKIVNGETINDFSAAQAGAIALAQNSYLAFYAGIGMPLAVDGQILGNGSVDDAALALPAGEEAVTSLVTQMVQVIQRYYREQSIVTTLSNGNTSVVANSVSASFADSLAAIVEALGIAAAGNASTTLSLALRELGKFFKVVNSNDFAQNASITSMASASIVGNFGDKVDTAFLTIKTALVLNSIKSAYYFLTGADIVAIHAATTAFANETSSALMTYATIARNSAKVWAVVTFVITSALLWTLFGIAKYDNGLQRSAALARTIAATITAAIMAIISIIPVIGPLIVAVISLIDLVAAYACKAAGVKAGSDVDVWVCSGVSGVLTRVIQYLIFDQYIVVNLKDKNRLQISLQQPTVDQQSGRPGFLAGNEIGVSATITNHISLAKPTGIGSGAQGRLDKLEVNDLDAMLTKSVFTYTVQPTQTYQQQGLVLGGIGVAEPHPWLPCHGQGHAAIRRAEPAVPLYLTEGFHIPTIECWGFVVQNCTRKDITTPSTPI